jgi:hypothetical protein
MANYNNMFNQFIGQFKVLLSWITGTTAGIIISLEQLGQSVMTVITSVAVSFITYFLTRYLAKKFPPNSQKP